MIKNNFKTSIIKQFRDSFSDISGYGNYIFIGRSVPWQGEPNPETERDTLNDEIDVWNNMLVIRKIKSSEVALCVRKILWTSNFIYDQYDDSIELFSSETPVNFYVMNEEKNVYKCISNNNRSESTYSPSGTSTDLIKTNDGYVWKYLYTIRPELEPFISNDYIPVEFLDRTSYEESDVRNEQLAVEYDAKKNGAGKISDVIITQIGAPYYGAIDHDPYPSEIDFPEALHIVQSYSTTVNSTYPQGISYVGLNYRLPDVSKIANFYLDNYVIYISSGPGVGEVRDILSYDGSTGIVATNGKFSVDLGIGTSSYKILPKVVVKGDGTGASCIAELDLESKKIKNIKILNPGKNYKIASIEIKTKKTNDSEKTKARAIKSPVNGHGSDASMELGCRNLMVRVTFDPRDSEKLNFFNDYRQIGIIQNPSILNQSTTSNKKTVLEVDAFNAYQFVTLQFTTPTGIIPIEFQSKEKLIGSVLVQGDQDTNTSVIGIITDYNLTTKVLKVSSLKNKFRINLNDASLRNMLYLQDIDSTVKLPYVKIKSSVSYNHFTDTTFKLNDRILSDKTNTTAIVQSWKPNSDGVSGELTVGNVNGNFQSSYYLIDSTITPGEKFTSYTSDYTKESGDILYTQTPARGTIVNKIEYIENSNDILRVATVLEVSRSAGETAPFIEETFTRDSVIQQVNLLTGEIIAKGTVVDWVINSSERTKGTLIVNVLEGNFIASTERNIYQYNTISNTFDNIQNTIICTVTNSEAQKYTGNMIYIDNTRPILHGTDSLEEFKIVIGF